MTNRPEIRALTGIRAVAALAVVLFHFRHQLTALFPTFEALEPLTSNGDMGVDLFFTLSGFILTYNYAATLGSLSARAHVAFLGRRLARIYPLHLFTMLLLVPGVAYAAWRGIPLNHPENFSAADLIRNLFLVQAWNGVPTDRQLSWNFPSWSISAEWFGYLLFPFMVALLVRLPVVGAVLVGAGALVVQIAAGAILGWQHIALVQISGEFVLGCTLGLAYLADERRSASWSLIAAAAAVAAVVIAATAGELVTGRQLALPFFGLLVYALARASGPLTAWLESGAAVFFGRASYALYMLYGVVSIYGARILPLDSFAESAPALRIAVVAAYLVALLGGATLVHLFVEQPARHRLQPQPSTASWNRSAHARSE